MAVPSGLQALSQTCLDKAILPSSDIVRGDQLETWIAPVPVGLSTPEIFNVSIKSNATVDSTTIKLATDTGKEVLVYKGQVIWFNTIPTTGSPDPNNGVLAVVSGTRLITSVAAGVDVPVYPLYKAASATLKGKVRPLVPFISIETGAVPQSSGTTVESKPRVTSLYTNKVTYQKSATTTAEGSAYRSDPAIPLLDNAERGFGELIYVETRRPPFDDFGVGINANIYIATVESSSPSSGANDNSKLNYGLTISGSHYTYTPLGLSLEDMKELLPESVYVAGIKDYRC